MKAGGWRPIERWISNEDTRKRWRRFKRRKLSGAAIGVMAALTVASLLAEFLANNRPIWLSYRGRTYVPTLFDYNPKEFGRDDLVVMDYRALKLGPGDRAAWPIVSWDPYERNERANEYPAPPSRDNWFGTDDRGRDVFARLLYGYRYSMGYAILAWALVSALGAVAGAVMGYAGGWVDLVGQRAIEVIESLPGLLMLITLISIFEPALWLLVMFTAAFGWVTVSLYFRAEFLKLRRREFTEAARALGASRARVIFTHLLPNSLTPWLTMSPFLITGYISQLVALDFLGFGLRVPTPSWGELLAQAEKNFTIAWWLAVYPSAMIFLVMTMMNLIGEAVRDALDPRG